MFRFTQMPLFAFVLLAVLSYSTLANPTADSEVLGYPTYTTAQRLHIPFQAPKRESCSMAVTVRPDEDPNEYGIGLLGLPTTRGFPMLNVTVSSPESKGYAAFYGWIQFIAFAKSLPSDLSKAPWIWDRPPILANSNIPFVVLGAEPSFFDSPFYPNSTLDWAGRAFLCYIEDAVLTKHPRPLVAIEWGFVMRDHKPHVKQVQHVDTATWNDHVDLLRSSFKGWTFTKED